MNNTPEPKPTLAGEELKKLVIESVSKVFEADTKNFIDAYIKHAAKGKVAA